jgi:hypothetical protein
MILVALQFQIARAASLRLRPARAPARRRALAGESRKIPSETLRLAAGSSVTGAVLRHWCELTEPQ